MIFLKIGILSGGGDCAGINSAIRSATFTAEELGHELFGIKWGWKGLIKFEEMSLNSKVVEGIGESAGTILGTSRTNPFKDEGGINRSNVVMDNLKKHGYDSLITIGGNDTLSVSYQLDELGFPVVAIPKTMDYDLPIYSLGFDTATNKVKKQLVDFRTTASSHGRVLIVEVFGRDTGHVALHAGLAAMADVILIPEVPYNINEVCKSVKNVYERRKKKGFNPYAIVAVAEGAKSIENDEQTYRSEEKDEFGHKKLGGISFKVEAQINKKLGYETKATPLTYSPRSGETMCFDALTGEKLGSASVYVAHFEQHGVAVVNIKGNNISVIPIGDLLVQKPVNVAELSLYENRVSFGRPRQEYHPTIKLIKN